MYKTFSSKILLFGEHIINKGANGLALPFNNFYCTLSFKKTKDTLKESSIVLNLLSNQIATDKKLKDIFNLEAFNKDITNGLKLNMNIPIGYGLGSSGAICAGVYESYCLDKSDITQEIKTILGLLESAFHGKSSGLDPLVSYLNKTVLLSKNDAEIIEFSLQKNNYFKVFLIDTKKSRSTAPLVSQFLKKYDNDKSFLKIVNSEITPLTNEIINDFINFNTKTTYNKIENLSRLQLENFQDLILEKHIPIWHKALKERNFFLKICGAGGGGFMLGFCKDKEKVLDVFKKENVLFLN